MLCWQGHTELRSVHTTQTLNKHINCACVTLIWWANAESIDPLSYHRAASCKLDGVDVRHVVMVDSDARVIEIGGRENTALTVCGALNTAPSDSVTHGFVLGVHKPQVNNLMMPLVGLDDLKAWHCEQAQNLWEKNTQSDPVLCPALSARDGRRRTWHGPQSFSCGLQCQASVSYSRVLPRQLSCVVKANQNYAFPQSTMAAERGFGPTRKGGPAKKSLQYVRKTVSCRLTCAWSVHSANDTTEKDKNTWNIAGPPVGGNLYRRKEPHLYLQRNVLCKGWFYVASTICDLKCYWEHFSHIVSHKY